MPAAKAFFSAKSCKINEIMFFSSVAHGKEEKATADRILLIKGHSAGIGDILRSSAAWRALKNHFQGAELHLLFLTGEPGYPSEALISRHHLLDGFFAVKKRPKGYGEWKAFGQEIAGIMDSARPTLVIDFEPHGIRTSLIAFFMRLRYGVRTVGISEVPLRGFFYGSSSVSSKKFAIKRGLDFPLEYTNRDFVALSALGIERNGTPVELEETEEGRTFRTGFRRRFGIPADAPLLGLNIGCGTPGAVQKRPGLGFLSALVGHLQKKYGFCVVLTGAGFERDVNLQFGKLHSAGYPYPLYDLAGETGLPELTGLIRACRLFISTDSGPYHMAVALRVPTLAIFTSHTTVHFHHEPWVRCVVMKSEKDIAPAVLDAEELLNISLPEGATA